MKSDKTFSSPNTLCHITSVAQYCGEMEIGNLFEIALLLSLVSCSRTFNLMMIIRCIAHVWWHRQIQIIAKSNISTQTHAKLRWR